MEEDVFKVDWPENNVGEVVEREIEVLDKENKYMRKEADVCGLVIRLFTAFSSEQLKEAEK